MKLQICRGNLPYVSVPRWWRKFQGIKRRLRKPNHTSADQSTSTRILTGILSSLFLVPWVYGSFISLGYPQNSWGVEVNPSPKIRCFTLMPTPLVAIVYFPLTSLVSFGFPIQRTAIPTTRLRPSEKRELFRKLFLNNFCKHVLELIVPHYLTRRNLSLVLFPLKVFHPRWLTSRTGPLLPHFSIDRSHCQRNIFLKFINQRTVIYISEVQWGTWFNP